MSPVQLDRNTQAFQQPAKGEPLQPGFDRGPIRSAVDHWPVRNLQITHHQLNG
jgi:hypothetical protein